MFKLIFLICSLPSAFLLIDTAASLPRAALALAQDVSIANQSINTNKSLLKTDCGKYCENYPPGMTEVRLRDWQR